MTLNRDQLFSDLDALTVEQIEAGLAAGVWGDDGRPTVEHYVLKRRFAADQRNVVVTATTGREGGDGAGGERQAVGNCRVHHRRWSNVGCNGGRFNCFPCCEGVQPQYSLVMG